MEALDLIAIMDADFPDWRESPYLVDAQAKRSAMFKADLSVAFYKANPSYMDDVTPAIITGQLEWIMQVMDNANACGVMQATADSIYNYIKDNACEWLLEEEARAIAWD